jgi:putative transposase
MPDHMHALAEARTNAADLRRFVWSAKQRSGYLYRRRTGRRLWQKSYYDRTLRENLSSVDVIKYIVNNPLRRGLVRSPVDYPHWGSQIYSRDEILEFIARPAV